MAQRKTPAGAGVVLNFRGESDGGATVSATGAVIEFRHTSFSFRGTDVLNNATIKIELWFLGRILATLGFCQLSRRLVRRWQGRRFVLPPHEDTLMRQEDLVYLPVPRRVV